MGEATELPLRQVTLVITLHREGRLAHHTFRAVRRCVEHAVRNGVEVAVIAVLDRADDATRSFVADGLGAGGYFDGLCATSVVEVGAGDAGLARNAGIAEATTAYVGVVDADNLPSYNWLVESVVALEEHGSPAIAHPESIWLFGGRHEVWPQLSSDDDRMQVGNFVDCNYWDTFCMAHREVFDRVPYAETGRTGLGYEDWHWNTRTLAAELTHLSVAGTAYFYRIKPDGSVNSSHHSSGSLIPPSELLTDPKVAAAVLEKHETDPSSAKRRPRRTPQLREVLRERRHRAASSPRPTRLRLRSRLLGLWLGSPVVPHHYRLLYPDLRTLTAGQLRRHYRRRGAREGRRARLTAAELGALSPEVFNPRHYRLLHDDLAGLSDQDALLHYLTHGRVEGRRTMLTRVELRGLRAFDVDDYRLANRDLAGYSDDSLVAHYVHHGIHESRRCRLSTEERLALGGVEIDDRLREEWYAMHRIEPLVPVPSPGNVAAYRLVGPPMDGSITRASAVWWRFVEALGTRRPKAIFFVPRLWMGEADILIARYARLLAESRPDLDLVVVTTRDSSSRQDWLSDGVQIIELPDIEGFSDLGLDEQRRLVAAIIVQYQPELVHVFDSGLAYDAFEAHPKALTRQTRIFLSTFVIDLGPNGEIVSHLAKRRTGFLDRAAGVIVDNRALVDQLWELYRFPREKFHVHHQAVDLPERGTRPDREAGRSLRVVWAASFDRRKRLDVLAEVVEATAAAGLDVEWHVYGAPVTEDRGTDRTVERLRASGALLQGTYSAADPLPLDDFDAFVLTSESEGIPLTLLEVMAARLPVIAPLVGGIPELIDDETGFPIRDFEDVAAYVDALRCVDQRPDLAAGRAEAGYRLVETGFSWEAFQARVAATPGYLTTVPEDADPT